MAETAILYDSSKCSGCKGCQVQCKQWNMLPSSLVKNGYEFTGTYQSMANLDGDTRLLITFGETNGPAGVEWAFGRKACFHCTEPACMSVCPVGAISKLDSGVVQIDNAKCIGCKYCSTACPFEVPKYRDTVGIINKCTQCTDRVAQGRRPACVTTCPAAALSFGPRADMLAAGKKRVEDLKTAGFKKAELYGETQMGGMHSLFIAKYGLEAHGLVRDPRIPDSAVAWQWLKPLGGFGIAAALGGLGISLLTGVGYKRDEATVETAAKKEE